MFRWRTYNSLGLVDLDLSPSPDVFGLQAFDSKLPLTRMLPGSNPCELRLLLPDSKIGMDGFHDVVIENLSVSPALAFEPCVAIRYHVPASTMAEDHVQDDAEACEGSRAPPPIRSSSARVGISSQCARFLPHMPGKYRVCLHVHMMGSHLELGQLWRCPVEWCTVWKGSVSDCLGHFNEKHGGSTFFALKNVAKLFPPWKVTRDAWQAALRPYVSGIAVDTRIFHEAECRLVHKYRVYKDPFLFPALREGAIPRLLSCGIIVILFHVLCLHIIIFPKSLHQKAYIYDLK